MLSKKILPFVATALIAGLVGYWIKPNSAPVKDCNSVVMNYSDSPVYSLIDGRTLLQMTHNYRIGTGSQPIDSITNSYTKVISNSKRLPDATSVWFRLEDLKRFIWEIESKVCAWQDSCPNLNGSQLGVRIYYARYSPTGKFDQSTGRYLADLPDSVENQHTVFMVPTFDAKNNNPLLPASHIDFNLNGGPNNGFCQQKSKSNEGPAFRAYSVLIPTGKNHGDLCPPICNAGDAVFSR